MSLKTYRPGPEGLEPNPVQVQTWRSRLRSRRWKPAPLSNPELPPTSSALAFWIGLAVLTFAVLVFGYGIGLWGPIT
jgi:hypothetical protein